MKVRVKRSGPEFQADPTLSRVGDLVFDVRTCPRSVWTDAHWERDPGATGQVNARCRCHAIQEGEAFHPVHPAVESLGDFSVGDEVRITDEPTIPVSTYRIDRIVVPADGEAYADLYGGSSQPKGRRQSRSVRLSNLTSARAIQEKVQRSKTRKRTPKGEPKPCGCGCGEMTKGGNFAMGHDARHRSAMLKAMKVGPDRLGALAEIGRYGWERFADPAVYEELGVPYPL